MTWEYSSKETEPTAAVTAVKTVPERHLPEKAGVPEILVAIPHRRLTHILHHVQTERQPMGHPSAGDHDTHGRSEPRGVDRAGRFEPIARAVIFPIVEIVLKVSSVGQVHLVLRTTWKSRGQQQR